MTREDLEWLFTGIQSILKMLIVFSLQHMDEWHFEVNSVIVQRLFHNSVDAVTLVRDNTEFHMRVVSK